MDAIWTKIMKAARDSNEPAKAATATSSKEQAGDASSGAKPSGAVDIDQDVPDTFNQLPPLPSPLPITHKDFLHCMPPEQPIYRKFTVFTAGSIEMGAAVQWQKQMATLLSPLPITVCNPRRGHWDPNITPDHEEPGDDAGTGALGCIRQGGCVLRQAVLETGKRGYRL
jgi:hypothetical protein